MTNKLPAPRLQLRWERRSDEARRDGRGSWLCNYELVLPLRNGDIRRDRYAKNGRLMKAENKEFVVLMRQQFRASDTPPCTSPGLSGLYYDTPMRDGAHAQWDSEALGGLPIYAIALDGTAIQKPQEDTP